MLAEHLRTAVGESDRVLAGLLAAWQEQPAPELADAIERVSAQLPASPPITSRDAWIAAADTEDPTALGSLLRDLVGEKVTMRDLAKRVAHLASLPGDPRVASRLVALIGQQPFTARSSKRPLWEPLFATLADRHADPRSVAALRALKPRAFGVTRMADWFREQVAELASTLAARFKKPPALTAAEAKSLAAIVARKPSKSPAPARRVATKATEADLLAAVFASPDEDAPRLVYADYLLEKGDKRGELIQLQLKPKLSLDERKRAYALAKKHGEHWAGPIYQAFLVQYQNPLLWRRGFLDGGTLLGRKLSKKFLAETTSDPRWATVRWLAFSQFDPKSANAIPLVAHPCMRSLRELVDAPDAVVAQLASDGVERPLEALGVQGWDGSPEDLPGFRALVELRGLSSLRRVRIEDVTDFDELAPLWQSPALAARPITIVTAPIADDAAQQLAAALNKKPPPRSSQLRFTVFAKSIVRDAKGKFVVGADVDLPAQGLFEAREEQRVCTGE
jgi:uncharacterized protein (TIGR02996 family)